MSFVRHYVFSNWLTLSKYSILITVPNCPYFNSCCQIVCLHSWCQIDSFHTLGAKLGPVPNWLRCQIDSFHTLGAKLGPVPNWVFYTLGAKLGPVPNWVWCQIGSGAKLSTNPCNKWGRTADGWTDERTESVILGIWYIWGKVLKPFLENFCELVPILTYGYRHCSKEYGSVR